MVDVIENTLFRSECTQAYALAHAVSQLMEITATTGPAKRRFQELASMAELKYSRPPIPSMSMLALLDYCDKEGV